MLGLLATELLVHDFLAYFISRVAERKRKQLQSNLCRSVLMAGGGVPSIAVCMSELPIDRQ